MLVGGVKAQIVHIYIVFARCKSFTFSLTFLFLKKGQFNHIRPSLNKNERRLGYLKVQNVHILGIKAKPTPPKANAPMHLIGYITTRREGQWDPPSNPLFFLGMGSFCWHEQPIGSRGYGKGEAGTPRGGLSPLGSLA